MGLNCLNIGFVILCHGGNCSVGGFSGPHSVGDGIAKPRQACHVALAILGHPGALVVPVGDQVNFAGQGAQNMGEGCRKFWLNRD